MDTTLRPAADDPVVVTGWGEALGDVDPTPFLLSPKTRKYMGRQDELALVAAALAARDAALSTDLARHRIGLYCAVGYIPFEREDLDGLADGSIENGAVSLSRFARVAFASLNPLLTFKCLSNMPAYHVSANLDIQGPYLVTYPGPGPLYQALSEACHALSSGLIDAALVLGVAHQTNALVQHHLSRIGADPGAARDAAACLVLERDVRQAAQNGQGAERPRLRVHAVLNDVRIAYRAWDPFVDPAPRGKDPVFGAASLPLALRHAERGPFHHTLEHDGFEAASDWEVA